MFRRLSNGWGLAQQSFRVLMLDKELLLFPAMSGLACFLVLASFALPLWQSGEVEVILNERQPPQGPLAYLLLFAFYFVNYFVIVSRSNSTPSCCAMRS